MGELACQLRENYDKFGFSVAERIETLKNLYEQIFLRHKDIEDALKSDFNKNSFDAYATEIGMVLCEIRHTLSHIKRWTKPKRVKTALANFPAKARIFPQGYGAVLIIAPWNYPFMLSMCPLIGAIAGGNYVALKPSIKTPRTFEIIKSIIDSSVSGGKVCVTSSREVLAMRWDYIFFTGSSSMGKTVLAHAAQNLTPVTLELGGKSPCIIDKDAFIKTAARRTCWGKFLNGGQTCVAPDYFLVHSSIKDEFIGAFIDEIKKQFYSADGTLSSDFTHLISTQKAQQVAELIKGEKILFGGKVEGTLFEPTVIEASFSSPIMSEEIFAPVAPIISFDSLDDAIQTLSKMEKPLALYYFGSEQKKVNTLSFGGGCFNDVLCHVAQTNMPFGGVGNSGMGRYHGKYSFDTFTHYKSVIIKGKRELKLRYSPHSEKSERFMKRFFR